MAEVMPFPVTVFVPFTTLMFPEVYVAVRSDQDGVAVSASKVRCRSIDNIEGKVVISNAGRGRYRPARKTGFCGCGTTVPIRWCGAGAIGMQVVHMPGADAGTVGELGNRQAPR